MDPFLQNIDRLIVNKNNAVGGGQGNRRARVTSSRNRSTRTASRRPTSSKTRPQRSRAARGKALVTQGKRGPARGAQGPRNPPQQGPVRSTRNITIGGNTGRPNPAPPKPNAVDQIGGKLLRQGLNNLGYTPSKTTTPKDLMGIFNLVKGLVANPGAAAGALGLFGLAEGVATPKTADGTLKDMPKAQSYSGMADMSGDPIKPTAQPTLSAGAQSFDRAFAQARSQGLAEFTWRGKRYNTKYAGE